MGDRTAMLVRISLLAQGSDRGGHHSPPAIAPVQREQSRRCSLNLFRHQSPTILPLLPPNSRLSLCPSLSSLSAARDTAHPTMALRSESTHAATSQRPLQSRSMIISICSLSRTTVDSFPASCTHINYNEKCPRSYAVLSLWLKTH
jgi:hypothetical protein